MSDAAGLCRFKGIHKLNTVAEALSQARKWVTAPGQQKNVKAERETA